MGHTPDERILVISYGIAFQDEPQVPSKTNTIHMLVRPEYDKLDIVERLYSVSADMEEKAVEYILDSRKS